MSYWQVSPHHSGEFDFWVHPADSELDHRRALDYLLARAEEAWDSVVEGQGPVSVSIELVTGDMPEDPEL